MADGYICNCRNCMNNTVTDCSHFPCRRYISWELIRLVITGPVVRITPDEIHLSDPDNCDKIYHVGSRYGKNPAFYGAFGTKKATFTTPSPDIHRVKRAALNPFFSRKKVLDLEEIVQQKARRLVSRMETAFQSTGHIDLHHGFRAISVDVITDYAFDTSYNFLSREDFGVQFFNMIRDFGPAFWFFQQFPAVQPIALSTPFWVAKLASGALTRMMLHHEVCLLMLLMFHSNTSRIPVNKFYESSIPSTQERKYLGRLSFISYYIQMQQRVMLSQQWKSSRMRRTFLSLPQQIPLAMR